MSGSDTKATRPLHVVLMGGQSDSLTIFRAPLIRALIARGHRVTTLAGRPDATAIQKLTAMGAAHLTVPLDRTGGDPLADVWTLWRLTCALRSLKPDVFLAYQIKPVTYGLIAAWAARVPRRIGMITGLGYAFVEEPGRRLARALALIAYRLALPLARRVIFQNHDDIDLFTRAGLLRPGQAVRVHGSGVDLQAFAPAPLPKGVPAFLLIARLIRDKGVADYVQAARIVRARHPEARFRLVGPFDSNPARIEPATVEHWVEEGVIDYLGPLDDVRPAIAQAGIFVLPSYYREGAPRTILEAMAMGRPVITTDVAGCRDTIVDGESGLLIPPRDPAALAQAMLRLIGAPDLAARMGRSARLRAEALFDAETVSAAVIAEVEG